MYIRTGRENVNNLSTHLTQPDLTGDWRKELYEIFFPEQRSLSLVERVEKSITFQWRRKHFEFGWANSKSSSKLISLFDDKKSYTYYQNYR